MKPCLLNCIHSVHLAMGQHRGKKILFIFNKHNILEWTGTDSVEYHVILIGHSQNWSSSAILLAVRDKSWTMVRLDSIIGKGCTCEMWNVFQNWSEDATAGLWPPPGLGSHLQGLIFPTFLFCYWKSALSDLHWGTAKWLGQVWCGGGICSIWQGITLSSTAVATWMSWSCWCFFW